MTSSERELVSVYVGLSRMLVTFMQLLAKTMSCFGWVLKYSVLMLEETVSGVNVNVTHYHVCIRRFRLENENMELAINGVNVCYLA